MTGPDTTLALIGAGKMAECLIAGWVEAGFDPRAIAVTNRRNDGRLAELAGRYGVRAARDKATVLKGARVVLMAVKPADMATALEQVAPHLEPGAVVVSVAAGIRLADMARRLPGHPHLVRAMPNTASRLRQAVTALCAAPTCSPEASARARWLFDQVGATVEVGEEAFDAVTALSGSGPAYVYLLVEAMLEAARDLGLPDGVARDLAVWTVVGAGSMLRETGLPPAELRRQVTSPNGTTAAAIAVLEEMAVPVAVRRAVKRAAARAAELAALIAGSGTASPAAPQVPGTPAATARAAAPGGA
ncbi:pyrroline-5-carboxylate reductase [Thermaerobacter marianensis DSM 12885]|uniref:Pyrroline-5-carboxylate reductase n=1 Tax=Thermaerobacter marianensis (strain ATCC 700841 / DSM 12885 / JCM 10246 / 7p75a) TaxID=644966 RepID=E6SMR0_THEM7|nr:pyrroline-5-carboxylate reductase [Thermaerobacter marianensis]ADU51552.1 pyrroline-5-carboxylate reductase [Thermaerobacter marianensis DSM 12885]